MHKKLLPAGVPPCSGSWLIGAGCPHPGLGRLGVHVGLAERLVDVAPTERMLKGKGMRWELRLENCRCTLHAIIPVRVKPFGIRCVHPTKKKKRKLILDHSGGVKVTAVLLRSKIIVILVYWKMWVPCAVFFSEKESSKNAQAEGKRCKEKICPGSSMCLPYWHLSGWESKPSQVESVHPFELREDAGVK